MAKISEEYLRTEPIQVVVFAEFGIRHEHRLVIEGVLPIEVHAHVMIEIPVDTGIGGAGAVGPIGTVGQTAGEYLIAQLQVGEAEVCLNRSRIEASIIIAERASRLRQIDAASNLLAGQ